MQDHSRSISLLKPCEPSFFPLELLLGSLCCSLYQLLKNCEIPLHFLFKNKNTIWMLYQRVMEMGMDVQY